MERVLHGFSGVVVYIDDSILVMGEFDDEHLHNLDKVLERLTEHGMRLKKKKCQPLKPSVDYLGYVVDAESLHPMPDKVEVTLTKPLNALLEQGRKWLWTVECEKAFNALENALTSDHVFIPYDPDLPLKVDCDASSVGLGAVIYLMLGPMDGSGL